MKSSTLIVSYLWKDTWKRWCEQPGSPLARLWVTALLVLVATVILTAFQLIERSVRERLERLGLDTLLVRKAVTPDSPGFFLNGSGPDEWAVLGSTGRKVRLRQLFTRGQTEWSENNLMIFTYPPEALPVLAGMLEPALEGGRILVPPRTLSTVSDLTPHPALSPLIGEGKQPAGEWAVVYASETLPVNARVRVRIGHRSVVAGVERPPDWLRGLCSDDFLLAPQGWLPDGEQLGWVETTVFQRGPNAPPMERIIAAVNALATVDQVPAPQIQSALPLMRELDELQQRHREWRAVLAGILGAAVSLVYGAIAVLEFRQNLFVGALLRSFGAPAALIYFRQWLENVALANLAAVGAILLVVALRQTIFGTFGFSAALQNAAEANPYTNGALNGILVWVNVGAFLSSLPVAAGLRQPVGEILN